jgi:acetoin utilization deacetylase AcuC-like enzyme
LDNIKTGSVQAFHPGGFLDMMTGVFFHQEFSFKDGPIIGNKVRNFPAVMQKVLSKEGVVLFEPKPATDEMLLRVHTKSYIKEVKLAWYDKGASLAEEV